MPNSNGTNTSNCGGVCNSCNCKPVKNIGCFGNCGKIETDIIAEQTGEHIVRYNHLGAKYPFKVDAVQGEKIVLPNEFPEKGWFDFQIIQPDGKRLICKEEIQTETDCGDLAGTGEEICYKYFRIEKTFGYEIKKEQKENCCT